MDANDFRWRGNLPLIDEIVLSEVHKLSWESVDFRGAANAAVQQGLRPIQIRVLERVCASQEFFSVAVSVMRSSIMRLVKFESDDGTSLLQEVLNDAFRFQSVVLPQFYESLARDSRFEILLLEEIDHAKRWSDLFGKGYRGFGSRLLAAMRKIFAKSHPASRIVASILLSGVTLTVALKVLPLDEIKIPLKLEPTASPRAISFKLATGSDPVVVPVQFSARDSLPLMVRIENSTRLSGLGRGSEISAVVDKLGVLDREIGDVSETPSDHQSQTPDTLVSAVRSLSKNLEDLSKGAGDNSKQSREILERLVATVSEEDIHARSYQRVLGSTQGGSSVSIPENGSATVFLQWLDAKQEPASCLVTATVKKSSTSKLNYDVALTLDECSRQPSPRLAINSNESFTLNRPRSLGEELPFHLILTHGERPLFGKSQILLRFQPDAQLFNRDSKPILGQAVAIGGSVPRK